MRIGGFGKVWNPPTTQSRAIWTQLSLKKGLNWMKYHSYHPIRCDPDTALVRPIAWAVKVNKR